MKTRRLGKEISDKVFRFYRVSRIETLPGAKNRPPTKSSDGVLRPRARDNFPQKHCHLFRIQSLLLHLRRYLP